MNEKYYMDNIESYLQKAQTLNMGVSEHELLTRMYRCINNACIAIASGRSLWVTRTHAAVGAVYLIAYLKRIDRSELYTHKISLPCGNYADNNHSIMYTGALNEVSWIMLNRLTADVGTIFEAIRNLWLYLTTAYVLSGGDLKDLLNEMNAILDRIDNA